MCMPVLKCLAVFRQYQQQQLSSSNSSKPAAQACCRSDHSALVGMPTHALPQYPNSTIKPLNVWLIIHICSYLQHLPSGKHWQELQGHRIAGAQSAASSCRPADFDLHVGHTWTFLEPKPTLNPCLQALSKLCAKFKLFAGSCVARR